MSPYENQLCLFSSWVKAGRGLRRHNCPLSALFKLFASLCLMITISLIVYSWTELSQRRDYEHPFNPTLCINYNAKCFFSVAQAQTNGSLGLVNRNHSLTLFTERKKHVLAYCQKLNRTRQIIVQRNPKADTAKIHKRILPASRRFTASRRNWIFIKSSNFKQLNRFKNHSAGNLTPTRSTVARKWSIDWCPIYKAASSPWMAIFAKVMQILTAHTEKLIREGKLTFVKLFKDFRLNLPYSYRNSDTALIPNYKMLIVRHPFSRLLSAYRDKLERVKGREFYYRKYGYRILTQFRYADKFNQLREDAGSNIETFREMMSKILEIRNNVGIVGPTVNQSTYRLFKQKIFPSEERPTFHEFVQYLLRADPRSMDEHWRPMYLDCDPCKYDFDLILQVETMERDRRTVLNLLGLLPNGSHQSLEGGLEEFESIWKRWANKGQTYEKRASKKIIFGPNDLSPLAATYFTQVPKSDLKQLYLKYEPDFLLFNYSATPYLLAGKDENMTWSDI